MPKQANTNKAVFVGQTLIQTVNARELHGFLQSRKIFATWITDRIKKYGFVDGQDYTTTIGSPVSGNQTGRGGDRRTKDFHISIDMAKKLSMVERTDQGKQARLYFIECEKRLTETSPASTLPSYPEALRALADTVERVKRSL